MNRIIRGVYAYGRFLCEEYFVKCENNDCRLRAEIVVMTIIGSHVSIEWSYLYEDTHIYSLYLLINEVKMDKVYKILFVFGPLSLIKVICGE